MGPNLLGSPAPEIVALYTVAYGADDLVGMCALERGPRFDRDGVGFFTADADDVVTRRGVIDLVEGHRGVVHGDTSDDGTEASTDQEAAPVGKRKRQSVCITSGNGSYAHIAGADEGAAVADGASRGQGADLGEFGPHRQDRAEAKTAVADDIERPVEVDACADVRERGFVSSREIVDRITVRDVEPRDRDTPSAEVGGEAFEGLNLLGRVRVVLEVSRWKMRVHPFEHNMREGGDFGNEVEGVGEADTHASHTSVQRDVTGGGGAQATRYGADSPRLLEAGNGDTDTCTQSRFELVRKNGAEDENGEFEGGSGESFAQFGGGNSGRADVGESMGDGGHAQTVGVGFQDDDGLERGDGCGNFAEILCENIEIDVEDDSTVYGFHFFVLFSVPVVSKYTSAATGISIINFLVLSLYAGVFESGRLEEIERFLSS